MPPTAPSRLRGWDEIAAYLGVDKKTAQRYEKTKKLPITRPAGPHGMVVADPGELDAWLARGQVSTTQAEEVTAEGPSDQQISSGTGPTSDAVSEVVPQCEQPKSPDSQILRLPVALGCVYATLFVL